MQIYLDVKINLLRCLMKEMPPVPMPPYRIYMKSAIILVEHEKNSTFN